MEAHPGTIRQTDTTINFATVNNAKFGYFLVCDMIGSAGTGIYGANVIYTISAAKG